MDLDENVTSDYPSTSPSADQTSESPIDQSDINDLLVEYPYASEPSYFTRPNRYHGPPSTWRSWTANDRNIAESLDVARAEDLSVHLYNAFDLKKRSRAEQDIKTAHDGDQPGGKPDPADDEGVANQQFTPPDVWTAWPLRSRHVPQQSRQRKSADSSRLSTEIHMPSTPLAEALTAITLRHAKEKWEARSNEAKQPQSRPSKHDWKNERNLTKKMKSQESDSDGHDTAADHQSADSGSTIDSEATDNVAALQEKLPPGTQLFSSQAFATLDSSSSEDEVSTTGSEEDEPIFSADDDRARHLLQPSIRHILTQFEDLLGGLHQARAAYAFKGDDSRSRSRSRFSGLETTEDEQHIRSGSRAASVKRGRKRKRAPFESHNTDKEQTSRSRGRSTTRRFEKKPQAFALRDWSDVMGMALLKGWNVETVARASERCARLFGQNMAFRTFHQGTDEKSTNPQEEPWFEETLAYVPTTENNNNMQDQPERSRIEPQPMALQKIECVRTASPCSRCRTYRIRCQPLKPVSTKDVLKRVTCSACSLHSNPEAPCTGILVQPRPYTMSKTCPYPDCPRHAPAKPFAKKYHLQRHLTDVHGHLYSPPTSPAPPTPVDNDRARNGRETPDQIRLNATLTCPIPSCPRSTRPYKRSTRLYDHVRRTHPEFDVDALKKIAGRNGERGRYDRSRSQSRHAAAAQPEDISEGDDDNEGNMEEQSGRVEVDKDLSDAMQREVNNDH